jgi:hypothetical protein
MVAIDIVRGGTKIVSNVFSHISDGSYDDGAIHWVAERCVYIHTLYYDRGIDQRNKH